MSLIYSNSNHHVRVSKRATVVASGSRDPHPLYLFLWFCFRQASEPLYEPRIKRGGVIINYGSHTVSTHSATYFRVISLHDSGSFRMENLPRRQTMPYASYATTLPSSAVDHGLVYSPKMYSPTETEVMFPHTHERMHAVRPNGVMATVELAVVANPSSRQAVLVPAGRAGTGASRPSIAGMKLPHFLRGPSTTTACTTACSTAD